jgi:ubiquinone/menaquinone biosynthesis C-methylase UbiE
MSPKLRRASQRSSKRPAATKPEVDPKFISALLQQGWTLLREARDEEATDLAIRIVRLQETEETRVFFVECVKRWKLFPGAGEIRDIVARALHETWAKPKDLFGLAKGILKSDPDIGPAIQRAMAAWPRRLSLHELAGATGLARISTDPLLFALLGRGSVFDLEIEHFLTSIRAALLEALMQDRCHLDEGIVELCCALARQCYINEYVFDLTPDENDRANRLRDRISHALETNSAVSPTELTLLSSYFPLDCLPRAALLKRSWPKSVTGLLEQQIQTPAAQRKLRTSIPRITPIIDDTSTMVQEQYEENPFPRWVKLPPSRPMPAIDEWMPQHFPFGNFRKIGKGTDLDILIAGCGTGHHSLLFAQAFPTARILAVDLSMSSLCYAKDKTREMGVSNIEYAQADILELGGLDKRFDVISSSGVLHHLSDPERGWRALLGLLQPDGCMQIGVYSEHAHRNIIAVQRWLSERGFTPSLESIRGARQELIAAAATDAALASVLTFTDFYTTSEFRDLFRPTQMLRYTIPKLQTFLDANNLNFLGFILRSEIRHQFWARFSGQAEADLSLWDMFERENPDTFKEMYEFWIQKKRS